MLPRVLPLALLAAHCGGRPFDRVNGPIIGVWSHPGNVPGLCEYPACEYLVGSYAKWIESSGGRVVPLPYNASDLSVYDDALNMVNGVLFPGGDAALPEAATYVVKRVREMNDRGDFLPLWATCLGFEWMQMIIAGDKGVVTDGWKTENMTLATKLTEAAAGSRLLGGEGNAGLRRILTDTRNPVTFNYHSSGLAPEMFEGNAALSGFWRLLGYNDDLGKPWVSMVEAKEYPFYAVQWHPEKNTFEHGVQKAAPHLLFEDINHSEDAVDAAQALSAFFLREASRSTHAAGNAGAATAQSIWNWPIHTDMYAMYQQRYLIHWP